MIRRAVHGLWAMMVVSVFDTDSLIYYEYFIQNWVRNEFSISQILYKSFKSLLIFFWFSDFCRYLCVRNTCKDIYI